MHNENDYIDLRDFIRAIWKKRIFVISTTLFFLLVSVFIAFTTPNKYQSTVILSPLMEDTGTSTLASRFGGLTSITGMALSEQKVSKTTLGMEVMLSRKFFENFDKKYSILADLMAFKGWDIKTNTIIYDKNLYSSQNNEWVRSVSFPKTPKPSIQESHKLFLG
jgi:Chain length determinant protein